MAYAAVTSLAQTIELILSDHRHLFFFREVPEIRLLHDQTAFLLAYLEDLPGESYDIEKQVLLLAHRAEDVIEKYLYTNIQQKYYFGVQLFPESSVLFKVSRLKEILVEITVEIVIIVPVVRRKKSSLKVKELQPSSSTAATILPSRFASGAAKFIVVGFEGDLMAIKSRLHGESSRLQVIPIVGMGGIGKTTLARSVYDDSFKMQYFDLRAWVTTSQQYRAQSFFSSLLLSLKSCDENPPEQINEGEAELVYRSLKGRRYLIIVDDMWSREAWDDVKRAFPDDRNGSRIILTTRLLDLATYAGSLSSPPHQMHLMNADQSWNLLRRQVFLNEDCCPDELEKIGKMIAGSCRGLPLAISVIGGLLSTVSRTQTSWQNIAESVNFKFATMDGLAEILSLSFVNLPHHLRACFLYFGIFPEDYEILVSKLIKLWVAEGFLKQCGSESFEERAEEYLEDLVKRNLVLVTNKKLNGKTKSCRMHDLIRELCLRKAKENTFLPHINNVLPDSKEGDRRISISSNIARCRNIKGSLPRTIICFLRSLRLSSLKSFRLLRVLDILNVESSNVDEWTFRSQVCKLFLLRYLAFRSDMEIPSSIVYLQNLQILIIHSSRGLSLHISMLRLVRHLVIRPSFFLVGRRYISRALENLQTLSMAEDFECTEGIVTSLSNLKKLGIYYPLGHRTKWSQHHLNNLARLEQLECLKLFVATEIGCFRQNMNLAFPAMLRKLVLSGTQLPWNDMVLVSSLNNLQVLKLRSRAFVGPLWETDDEFPQLKLLLIEGSDLQHWETQRDYFPRLVVLMLHKCEQLNEIPEDIGEVPTLELIEVDNRNELVQSSAIRIKAYQQSMGIDSLQIRTVYY